MVSPEYRYEFREILTGRPIGEIPLYGVNFNVKLSDAGSGQGYFKLDGSNLPASYTPADIRRANAEMLEMTEPGFAEIIIYRNEIPLLSGHGEVISQTFGSSGKVAGVYWRTYEASPEFVTMDEFVCPRIWEFKDQLNIMRELWLLMQFQIGSNIRVVVPPEYPIGSSKFVSLEINAWDRKTYRSVMDDLAKQDDGFDWRVVTRMLGNIPTKYLELGYPTIGKSENAFFFEYGRNMMSYYYTRNLAGAGNIIYVTGEGSGQEALVGSFQNGTNLGKNYRRKDLIINDPQLSGGLVQARANMEGLSRTPPLAIPTVQLDDIQDFGEWWIGDWGVLSWPVGNERFPDGFETSARVTQIEVSPPSDSAPEIIKPTFQSLEGSSGDG